MSFGLGDTPMQFTPGKGDLMLPGQANCSGDWTQITTNHLGDVLMAGATNCSGDWMLDMAFTKGRGDVVPSVASLQTAYNAAEEQAKFEAAAAGRPLSPAIEERLDRVRAVLAPADADANEAQPWYLDFDAAHIPTPTHSEEVLAAINRVDNGKQREGDLEALISAAEDDAEAAWKFPWMASAATHLANKGIHYDWGDDWNSVNTRMLRTWITHWSESGEYYHTAEAHNRAFQTFAVEFLKREREPEESPDSDSPKSSATIDSQRASTRHPLPGDFVFDFVPTRIDLGDAYSDIDIDDAYGEDTDDTVDDLPDIWSDQPSSASADTEDTSSHPLGLDFLTPKMPDLDEGLERLRNHVRNTYPDHY